MRRFASFLLLVLALSLTVPQLVAQQSAPPAAQSVLQVVDTEPLSGQELGLDEAMSIYFDRTLDCTTVEAAFSITPSIEGRLDCAGASITFTPSAPLERASTYRVQLSTALRGADGSQLLEPYEITWNSVGFLAVSETFPAFDSGQVEPDTTLTIVFNRPVVPLTTLEEQDDLPEPLAITPPLEGDGRWLNTSIYVFEPDGYLAGNTQYVVRVLAGLEAVDGAVLPEDYIFSFTTQAPFLEFFSPDEGRNDVGLDRIVQARFNMPMDQASVESSFSMSAVGSDEPVRGTFEWSEDGLGFSFTPDGLLELATTYQVSIGDEAKAAGGGDPGVGGTTEWEFRTVPPPAVAATDPNDGEMDANPYRGFRIYFASPMDEETLSERVVIEPPPEEEPRFYYRDWSDSLEVSFIPYASADYTITLEAGAQDVYGNTIDEPFTFTYSTAPYTPEVNLQTPGRVGFYNAYREPTQVFVTYRNLSALDLMLHSVPVETYLDHTANYGNYSIIDDFGMGTANENLLRRWTIDPSVVPPNALRYDLLEFSADVFAASCPAALPSRLREGDTALVITEPDPVRARSAPQTGEIVELLYRDYSLPIVGQPVCGDDGLLWWPVQLRDESTAWVAESVGNEYLIAPRDPVGGATVEVAEEDGGALPPGVYYLETESDGYRDAGHMMIVATANLVMKNSIDQVLVWATDVQSGQPLANVPITIYDTDYVQVASGTTDADGLLQVDVPDARNVWEDWMALLQTDEHFGVGHTEWSSGIAPYNFDQSSNFYPDAFRLYAYTDRPVYRPGQPVYVRGVVRRRDDMSYTPPQRSSALVTFYDARGDIVAEQSVELTRYGTFSTQLDLAEDATLGFYYMSVDIPGRDENERASGGIGFQVAEYRLPEFQVEAVPETPEVVQGETIRVTVDSTYFFGGAVSDAQIEYSVISESYFFRYDGPGYYDFTDYNYDSGPSAYYATSDQGTIASGAAMTDAQGEFVIEVPAELGDVSQSQNFIIEATVRDETDQTVSGRATVTVHQGTVYIGARPESYVSRSGEETTLNLIAVDWDSDAVADQTIDIEIVERRWSSVQEQDERGRTTWTWEVEEIPVTEGQVTTGEDGQANFAFTPPNGGIFKVYITTRDEFGNEVVASTYMWVSSRSYVSWRQQNSNRIELIADQEDYNVGDTAEILITSPFQGTAEALITVERGDVLYTDRITMDSNSYVYELPILESFSPNVYVSVMIVKGVDENNPVAGFRMGYVQISVDTERREIGIEITSDVDRASPQQTVTYTVRTTDWQGNPVSAEVGVGVTDLAALSLAPMNSRPLLNFFYGDQALGVRTATPLTINTDQLTQEVLDTVKGGGGGLVTEGIIEIRGEFIDTPYWNAHIVTDENGEATFEVRLPDNLTTWRLDARAVTLAEDGNMLVGQDTFDLLSTKPLIVRPVTPRFFVVDDEVVLAAVVNNNTEDDLETVVTINASGVTLHSDAAQLVTVPAGGRVRVTWEATVNDAEAAQMTFTADAGQYSDGSISGVSLDDEGTLPIYRYEAPETVGTAGVLSTTDSRVESIMLPQRFDVTQGTLTVQVDSSLAATTLDSLEVLETFPHYCTEQIVSRFLPNIMTYRALESFSLGDEPLRDSLDHNVNVGLQTLLAQQHSDGGWGWFVRYRSSPLVTAYALLGLTEARAQGYPVPDRVFQRAQDYLRSSLRAPSTNQRYWEANRQAFVLYALARSGAPDAQATAAAYEHHENLHVYGRALLAETFFIIDPTDTTRTDVLMNDILNRAITSAAGVHWEEDRVDYQNWNTDTRTTALVLRTMIKLRPESDLIPNVVRYLMVQRSADAWETTQETAWVVMALTDWMVQSGELQPDYAYDVSFNDATLAQSQVTADNVRERTTLEIDVSDMLQDQANELVFTRTGTNDGMMYYTAYLEAYLPVPQIEAVDNGIIVERRYTRPGDETSLTEARIGEVVQARLTIIVPEARHYVVVHDPLPAGAEGINPNLETSQQIGTRPGLDNDNPLRYGWGWWYFGNIEFRDEAVVLYADYLPAGTYEYVYTIRPSVEGVYNVIPPTAEEFYFPDVYGRGSGMAFTVLPAQE